MIYFIPLIIAAILIVAILTIVYILPFCWCIGIRLCKHMISICVFPIMLIIILLIGFIIGSNTYLRCSIKKDDVINFQDSGNWCLEQYNIERYIFNSVFSLILNNEHGKKLLDPSSTTSGLGIKIHTRVLKEFEKVAAFYLFSLPTEEAVIFTNVFESFDF
jgi:hypothetical protein